MSLQDKARKRRETSDPTNWRVPVSVSLHATELEVVERLCKHYSMTRSALFRYLILKAEEELTK